MYVVPNADFGAVRHSIVSLCGSAWCLACQVCVIGSDSRFAGRSSLLLTMAWPLAHIIEITHRSHKFTRTLTGMDKGNEILGMMLSDSSRFRALGLRKEGILLHRGSERSTLGYLFLTHLIGADKSNNSIALS